MRPLVSIVIPLYNAEKYIDICMNGLLEQTYDNIEIIMVNDGSKDSSAELCDKYAAMDGRVKVIHKKNNGVSEARNTGIEQATGKYIMFFDVDDVIEKNTVEDNVLLAEENDADLVMYSFWYYNVDEEKLIPNPMSKKFVGSAAEFFESRLIETLDTEVFNPPWNKVIKRSILEKNDLKFDKRYQIYEDAIFTAELLMCVDRIALNNGMYYRYCIKSSGSLITKFNETFFESVSQLYNSAMVYCSKYKDNEKQIKRFNQVYTTLTMTHLKQISCKKDMSPEKKYELIKRICDSDLFVNALKDTDLHSGKKKIMRKLIVDSKCKAICNLYNLLNKIQNK